MKYEGQGNKKIKVDRATGWYCVITGPSKTLAGCYHTSSLFSESAETWTSPEH